MISGLVSGSLYALVGVGLVLIYRSSGILNFAQGDMATLMVFIAWSLLNGGLPWPVTAALVAVLAGTQGVIAYSAVVRPVQNRGPLTALVVTFGLGLILHGTVVYLWGSEPRGFPAPVTGPVLTLGAVSISRSGLLALAVALIVMLLMWLVIQHTRAGIALRATYQNVNTAKLMGIRTGRIYASVWAVSGVLGGIAAMLLAPLVFLSPYLLNQLLLVAFAAIVIGGLSSPLGAVIGGLVLGVVQALISTYVSNQYQSSVLFLILLLTLTLRPQGLFGSRRPEFGETHSHAGVPGITRALARLATRFDWLPRRVVGRGLLLVGIAVAVSAPLVMTSFYVSMFTQIAVMAPIVLSVVVITGYAGQLSIGQAAFAAIGAYAAAIASTRFGLPLPVCLLVAILTATVAGLLLGLPSLRMSGPYLALVTLGFAWAVPEVLLGWEEVTGGYTGILLSDSTFLGVDLLSAENVYYLIMGASMASCAAVAAVLRTNLGKRWRAIRDNEIAAASVGIRVSRYKLMAFALAAALAGLGGFLTVLRVGFVSPESFTVTLSIQILLAAVIGGLSSWLGGWLGAAFIVVLPLAMGGFDSVVLQIAFGLSLLLVTYVAPEGLAGLIPRINATVKPMDTDKPVRAMPLNVPASVAEKTR